MRKASVALGLWILALILTAFSSGPPDADIEATVEARVRMAKAVPAAAPEVAVKEVPDWT